MTRQQRRHLDRELMKCARGIARITMKKNINLVDHNHKEFLSKKAARLRGKLDEDDS